MGDPAVGAMVGETFAQVADDFARRVLSPRQEARVATVLDLAQRTIARAISEGATVRGDGFFDVPEAEASELFEGVLLAARDEHEERKLPYLANMLADIAFDEQLTVEAANVAIRRAEDLSWLQLRLLSIVIRPDEFPLPDTETGSSASSWGEWAIGQTFVEMHNDGFFVSPPRPQQPGFFTGYDLSMSKLEVSRRGELLSAMMRLDTIPAEEVRPLYETLLTVAARHASEQGTDERGLDLAPAPSRSR